MERNGRQSNPAAFIDYTLQVGDFGDAVNWPTPGEKAHKSVQVPTGAAEDRVRATQEKEGHCTKDKVYQLHAISQEEKERNKERKARLC